MQIHLEEELTHLDLGDRRRVKRFEKVVRQLVSNPSSSINDQAYEWADIKGTYRFFSNERITESAIAQSIAQATRQRCLQAETVLCIQSTLR